MLSDSHDFGLQFPAVVIFGDSSHGAIEQIWRNKAYLTNNTTNASMGSR